MAQTFYNLLNSQAFWVVLIVWFAVCISWTERWKPVLDRLQKLTLKPVIFKKDATPEKLPFYPRVFLENIAMGFRDTLRRPFSDLIVVISKWLANLSKLIYDNERPFRTLGYLLFLVCFLFFILADAIAVANTLDVLGLSFGNVPGILTRFDIAVFGGSLLALIIGMALVFEVRAKESEFSRWSERDNRTRSLSLGMALAVTLFSFITLISWALFRLIALGRVENSPVLSGLLNWVLFGLVTINNALAAALCFPDAIMGITLVALIIGWLTLSTLYILDYLATILGSLIPFFIDVVYRWIYFIVDVLQWFISTPIQAILLPFRLVVSAVSTSDSLDKKNKNQKR